MARIILSSAHLNSAEFRQFNSTAMDTCNSYEVFDKLMSMIRLIRIWHCCLQGRFLVASIATKQDLHRLACMQMCNVQLLQLIDKHLNTSDY